jgi:cytochrome b subunit of formate dehydrogenase
MSRKTNDPEKVDANNLIDEILQELRAKGIAIDENVLEEVRKKVYEKIKQDITQELIRTTELRKIKEKEERKIKEKQAKKEKEREKEKTFLRFSLNFRFQHMILFVSCIILIITGMPMKFPDAPLMVRLVSLIGGLEIVRLLHRIGASLLIFVAIHHTVYTFLSREGLRDFLLLIPRPKDFFDFFTNIKYYLGKSKEKAQFDRFSYIEKFDYWAVYWGCVIMIGSGALLWFENFSLRYLPKFILDISKEAHSDEALLATLAIVIWHFYNVHFNPSKFPGSLMWWHGRITEEEMIEEHPLEYQRTVQETKKNDKDPEEKK